MVEELKETTAAAFNFFVINFRMSFIRFLAVVTIIRGGSPYKKLKIIQVGSKFFFRYNGHL